MTRITYKFFATTKSTTENKQMNEQTKTKRTKVTDTQRRVMKCGKTECNIYMKDKMVINVRGNLGTIIK